MKKYLAFLLCFMMIISLCSCGGGNVDNNENTTDTIDDTTESITDPEKETKPNEESPNMQLSGYFPNYESILKAYRRAINNFKTVNTNPLAVAAELFGWQDSIEKEWFLKIDSSAYLFYPGRGKDDSSSPHYKLSCGYAIKDLNGDGVDELVLLNEDYMVVAVFSMANGNPILLGNYIPRGSCWIDGNGWLHENKTGGSEYSTHVIHKIAEGGASLELIAEYGTDGTEWIGGVAVTKYYKLVNGEGVDITEDEYNSLNEQYGRYLGSHGGAAATKEYAGLTFTSVFTEAEIAMEMYEAVLNDQIEVYETNAQQYSYLKDCKSPYNRIPLCEMESLGYIYMDVDGDSVNELVIDCADTLVLRYYEGTVYVYPFTFRGMYNLSTDGSYGWNHTGQDFEYGANRITFDGAELTTKEVWRIVNDGEPNAEFYIDGKQVTEAEILKYFEENPTTKVEFSPLEVSWQNEISRSEAITLAEDYWGRYDIEENGYIVVPVTSSRAPSSVYVIVLKWFVIDHYSTIDEIWIDKNTGQAIVPYPYTPDAKG